MSKMLVAYLPCGCRAAVLLDATEPLDALEFLADCANEGLKVREEEHARIGAKRCEGHAVTGPSGE